jgi:HlyD family secretion protein
MKRGMTIIIVLVAIAIIAAGGVWYKKRGDNGAVGFRTAQVTRGDLLQTISASGTLQAEEVIDIGSQVTGQIASFGTDKAGKTIDYRSEVEAGKMLATIDPSVYKSEVDAAQAALDQAKAAAISAEADLNQLKAKLNQAQRDWERAQKLGPSDALAESSYDNYKALYEIAKANVGVGEATIVSTKAGIAAAQAALDKAQRNLGYCIINSPVDGVIIDRRVNIGQTVVSTQSASSLFLLAKDLRKMEIWASVNEADVGNVRPDQAVTFTVDAAPGRVFKGSVIKLRYNATMTNNVVTYTVEIKVDNSDLTLIPYTTANVSFEVARRENVLLVPNAALRYTPTADRIAGATESTPSTDQAIGDDAGKPRHRRGGGAGMSKHATIYIADGEKARPVKVERGVTDGVNTEIITEELKDGDTIIIGDAPAAGTASAETVNPFTPKLPSGGGRGMR